VEVHAILTVYVYSGVAEFSEDVFDRLPRNGELDHDDVSIFVLRVRESVIYVLFFEDLSNGLPFLVRNLKLDYAHGTGPGEAVSRPKRVRIRERRRSWVRFPIDSVAGSVSTTARSSEFAGLKWSGRRLHQSD
jgi:hypothetical protein